MGYKMTPPPSATASYEGEYAYAPEDIHAMMQEVTAMEGNTFWRAVNALLMTGLGLVLIIAILTYNPFDPTMDTAGLGLSLIHI